MVDREFVYIWGAGIYVKAGLEREKAALLVVIGAMRDGTRKISGQLLNLRSLFGLRARVPTGTATRIGQPMMRCDAV